jgi:ribosomal-protein-alanine N-acetyltransferase
MQNKKKSSSLNDIEIRTLGIFDIPGIVDIEAEVSTNPWGSSLLINELNKKGFIGLTTCNNEEKIFGFAMGQKIRDEFEIRKTAVTTKYQNNGIGLKLIRILLSRLKALNTARVYLEVGSTNIPAQKLYKKVGLKKQYVRKKYYNSQEDAFVLSKSLKWRKKSNKKRRV